MLIAFFKNLLKHICIETYCLEVVYVFACIAYGEAFGI